MPSVGQARRRIRHGESDRAKRARQTRRGEQKGAANEASPRMADTTTRVLGELLEVLPEIYQTNRPLAHQFADRWFRWREAVAREGAKLGKGFCVAEPSRLSVFA